MSDTFIFELFLQTSPKEKRIINIRMEAGCFRYNACLGEALRRLNLARDSKNWKKARKLPKSKERSQLFQRTLKFYDFSEYSLHVFVKETAKKSNLNERIDSQVAQKLATRAFQAVDAYAKGKHKKPRFKRIGQFASLEGKSNVTGIRFKNGNVIWNGLVLKPIYDRKDTHGVEAHALGHRVKYVRIVRRKIRGEICFYAQLILKGSPLVKKKNSLGKNKTVGLDLGPSSIAIVSETTACLMPLSELREQDKKIKKLQKALDRSRRGSNPDHYNEKRIPIKKGLWKRSKRYVKKQEIIAEEKRALAAFRKTDHGKKANEILSLGTEIKTEKLSYKNFQKQFGKSVGNYAPGLFIQILRRKAENAGGRVIEFSCYQTKLSQVCHSCDKVEKKALNERWHICNCGIKPVQRDLYSAFLARHVKNNHLDRSQAIEAWASAGVLLEQALLRCNKMAKGKQRLACFGLSQRQSCLSVEDGSMQDEAMDVVGHKVSRAMENLVVLPSRTSLL